MKTNFVNSNSKSFFDLDLNHKYLFFRRTKIIATIGPATSSPEKIRQLISKGLDVVRINFSHGNPEDHLRTIRTIRQICRKLNKDVAIIGDLCGPKIRVGKFKNNSVRLKTNSIVTITTRPILGDENIINSQYKGLVKEVSIGAAILLDDGNLELRVIKKLSDSIKAKVIRGGELKNNKGMNLPETKLRISALTEKDKRDVKYCIKGEIDYIALSFVRKSEDIIDLKNYLKRHKANIPIIAKIEKPEALENIARIIELSDGIMIARGDLGVELPTKKVPLIQNKLIQITNQYNKPVIVATQMLESMIEHTRPTRAEVTDVAGACLAGADAVMLSAETATGKYPLETFETMDSILRETEAYQFFSSGGKFKQTVNEEKNDLQTALSLATAQLSADLMVRVIFVITRSGYTARIVSSDRPAAPIIALTQSQNVARKLNLLWGVYPHLSHKEFTLNEYLKYGENLIKKMKLAKKGDFLIMLSGLMDKNITTNSIVIHKIF